MTMQAEFEHWYEHEFMGGLDGPGEWDVERNCYVQFPVHMAWKGYQAAYAAGQRAERKPATFTVGPTGFMAVDATISTPERAYEEGWNDAMAAIRNRSTP